MRLGISIKVRVLAMAIIVSLLCPPITGVKAVRADTGPTGEPYEIAIEGENANSHDFSDVLDGELFSGGKLLRLETQSQAPAGGYTAIYTFHAEEAGAYEMLVTSTPPEEVWTSPYSVRINDGEDRPVRNAQQIGNVNDTVRKFNIGSVALRQGDNTVTFRVKDRRSYGDYVLYLDQFLFRKLPSGVQTIATEAPFNVFEAGEDVKISVSLVGPAVSPASISVKVDDYWNQSVSESVYSIGVGEQNAEINLGKLDKGHYTVTAQLDGTDAIKETFLSVVTPFASRTRLTDSPFAIDAAASLLVKPTQTEDFAKALQLSGVTWMRDRLHWGSANTAPNVYDYSAFDAMNQAVTAKGIRTLNVYGDSPDWSHGPQDKMPDDLSVAYRFARDSADHFGSGVSAWEIWNEPDGGFTGVNESGDQYAAFLKAMAIGYRDSAAKPAVSIAGMAGIPDDYVKTVADNDVFPYADTYSFHAYPMPWGTYSTQIIPFPNNASEHLRFMEDRSARQWNAWLTEAGITIPTGSLRELTASEQAAQARYMVTSAVQSLAAGVDKHFWFVMPYYLENGNQYGMFSQSNAPYAAYQAIANATDMLGKGVYLGQVQNLPAGAEGHLFDSGNGQVMVVWSEQPQTVEWGSGGLETEWFDMMGVSRKTEAHGGKIAIPIGPDPIFIKRGELLSVPLTPSSRAPKQVYEAPPLTPAQRVVLSQNYEESARGNAKLFGAYHLKESDANTIELEIYNFNETVMEGTISGEVSGGWALDRNQESVSLAPGEKKEISFQLKAGTQVKPMAKSKVSFWGTFSGKSTSVSAAYVFTGVSKVQSDPLPGADQPQSWDLQRLDAIAASGTGKIEAGTLPGSVRFKYEFGETNQWAYPFLELPAGMDFADKSGFAFKVYADEDIPQTELKLIVNESNASRYYTLNGFSIKKGWNTFIVPFGLLVLATFGPPDDNNKLDLNRLTSVQIGINTQLTNVPPFEIASFGTYKVSSDSSGPVTPTNPTGPTGSVSPGTGVPKPTVIARPGQVSIDVLPDSEGVASAVIPADQLSEAIGEGNDRNKVFIEMKSGQGTREIRLELPVDQIQAAGRRKVEVIAIAAGMADFSIQPGLLEGQSPSGKLRLSVAKIDAAGLPETAKRQLGSNEAYEFRLSVDGKELSAFRGNVEVGIPYALKPGENPHKVVIYFIDEDGKLAIVTNGKYDPKTGKVVFTPEHFGKYAAAYVDVTFLDLSKAAWAQESIEALAARGIVQGVGADRFDPNREVTRSEFITMLMTAMNWTDAESTSKLNDAREGLWYSRAVAAAEKLGIVTGKPDGTFGANDPITRQDMAVLLHRAYQRLSFNADGGSRKAEDYLDVKSVPAYARDALGAMLAAGILEGTGDGRFAPSLHATRAQAATVIFRLYIKD